MKLYPLWNKNFSNSFPHQEIDHCDILIIGGGITGLTTAYFLKDSPFNTVLIEKGKIGEGVTYRSTAKISYLQRDIYQKLEKYFDYDTSRLYFNSQKDAMKLVEEIVSKNNIDCDFEKSDAYLFTAEEKNISKLEKERNLLTSFGVLCNKKSSLPLSFPICDAFFVEDSYQFDPKCYMDQLARIISSSITICEDTTAFNIASKNDGYSVTTNHGKIFCKYVVMASHYPFFLFPKLLPIKSYIAREYVNAAPLSKRYSFQAINIDSTLHSIRFYHDYIIYGSNQHRLTNYLDYEKKYKKSNDEFVSYFKTEPVYNWVNQDVMPNDFLPFIGRLEGKNSNIFIATGYRGWGMTNATLAAKIISDSILGIHNKYENLVSPNRVHAIGILNSIVDGCCYAKAYVEAFFYHPGSVYKIRHNGNSYFVYIDSDKKKHMVKTKCPHMKCDIVFNHKELTWDCPCHGSRFDIDGNLLEGPAAHSIKP